MTEPHRRSGFTLLELMLALGISIVVITAVSAALIRQQRAYAALAAISHERAELHTGLDVLAAELRGLSPGADSIALASDTALEIHSAIGASTVCAAPSANRITLPPDTLSNGLLLSTWVVTPDTGDVVLVFHDSSAAVPRREWTRHAIVTFAPVLAASACPPSTGFTTIADLARGAHAYDVTLATPHASMTGAPVRLLRRGRYSVYRASDGGWYLGYRRCPNGVCAGIQPVSGPYRGTTRFPLTLRYFDRNGVELSASERLTDVARVDLLLRAGSASAVAVPGIGRQLVRDSTLLSVSMRNAP